MAVRSQCPDRSVFLPESSKIIPVDECPVLSPLLAKTFHQLQDLARSNSLPGEVQEIEAFADSNDEKIALNIAFHEFTQAPVALHKFFRDALPQLESLLLLDQKRIASSFQGPVFSLTRQAASIFERVIFRSFR